MPVINITLTALLCRLFGISCEDVTGKMVSQIKAWQIGQSCLYAGERCSYEVGNISVNSFIVKVAGKDDKYLVHSVGHFLDLTEFALQLVSTAPYLIKATHTSPATKKVNDLQFLLEQSTVCKVTGEAVSEFSKDPADNSTNYCSLQNLMDGSDLISAEGYKQFSNKWICPGFDSANCTLL
ncbi:uncharacterized protein LOC142956024 [Anarhichas minor]|uniref:uncharacterized protein LOC142956024 n=1 Tax=Anarhichas minor TaxID=65739 RepID=UPI003F73153C